MSLPTRCSIRRSAGRPPPGHYKTVRETEAEAIAFVMSLTIGLDAGRASADYIHLYHGNATLLAESLEGIQQTSARILAALETRSASAQTEAVASLDRAS